MEWTAAWEAMGADEAANDTLEIRAQEREAAWRSATEADLVAQEQDTDEGGEL
jgi:hypothetical protein